MKNKTLYLVKEDTGLVTNYCIFENETEKDVYTKECDNVEESIIDLYDTIGYRVDGGNTTLYSLEEFKKDFIDNLTFRDGDIENALTETNIRIKEEYKPYIDGYNNPIEEFKEWLIGYAKEIYKGL